MSGYDSYEGGRRSKSLFIPLKGTLVLRALLVGSPMDFLWAIADWVDGLGPFGNGAPEQFLIIWTKWSINHIYIYMLVEIIIT